MMDQNIKIKQKRSFSDVINAAFAFIKQEFKPFGKIILLYAGIPTLLYSIFNTVYFTNTMNVLFNIVKKQGDPQEFVQNFSGNLLFMYLIGVVMFLFYYGLTHTYLALYAQDNKTKSTREVWNFFAKKFLPLFGYILLTGIFIGIAYFIVIMFFAITGSPIIIGVGVFISVLFIFYAIVVLSTLLMVKVNESVDYFMALRRCFYLVKNHWWETFGLIIIASIIGGVIQAVVSIPVSAYVGVNSFVSQKPELGTIATILVSITSTISTVLVSPLLPIFISFQYFSLVEHKDNSNLLDRINKINDNPEDSNE